ncbi:helix-turn-helix domain-containing protein [Nocardia brevicatena]|uniref:helix-turn-helix domain-containing protein n=1 Tax=Nocardia brevicatena TaxID=37327 RepID=UPI0005949069|nr:helix-turn-helix domain-containing protein [Nocardia brevicatena]
MGAAVQGFAFTPVVVPAEVWDRAEVRRLLTDRDVAGILRLVQQHTGASQQRLATALAISQGRINELINRRRQVTSLSSYQRLADGLGMPDPARIALGLAPQNDPVISADPAEITRTYPSQADAAADIRIAVHSADTIDVMAVRGLGILGLKDSLLREVIPADARLRALLLDPDSAAAAYRAQEIGESAESFAAGIRLALSRLRELVDAGRRVEVHLYDHVPVWRIISIDGPHGTMFVSAFTDHREAHACPTHRIEPNPSGVLHHAFRRTVEQTLITGHRVV